MTSESPPIAFRSCLPTEEPGASLIAAMGAEIGLIYDGLVIDAADMPKAGPAELSPPSGDVQVGERDGQPVCVGAIKRLDDEACEIKRMYVVPEARGEGLAAVLLARLEERARELGYVIARLDTGPRQPAALSLYSRSGYEPIANFNRNPMATFFGQKRL